MAFQLLKDQQSGAGPQMLKPGEQRLDLSQADGLFRALFQQTEIGVVLTGLRGGLLAANAGFCAIIGYTFDELRRLHPQDVTHPEDYGPDRAQIEGLMRGEEVPALEKRCVHKDGSIVWVRVARSLVRDARGQALFGLMLVQDITARKRVEHERAQLLSAVTAIQEVAAAARARAEEALQLRDAFISTAAHELRTPLTALIGQTRLLQRRLADEGLSDQNRRALEIIIGQVQRLNTLISDLLDGASMEAGQLTLRKTRFDLGALLEHLVARLQSSLTDHTLSYSIEGGPLSIEGDVMRLDQAFEHLLANAVKYSPQGGSIALRACRRGRQALISLRDEGVGIPNEALSRVFERFYRAPNADLARGSGVGVGLYMVRAILAQHGGQISVESQIGSGSTFTVTLPICEPS